MSHATTMNLCEHPAYELRFRSLSEQERTYVFPCDAQGRVDLDSLGARTLANYMYARAVVGRLLRKPIVEASPVAAA